MKTYPTNLKRFNRNTCSEATVSHNIYNKPRIVLTSGGYISLSMGATRLLEIQAGDGVELLQDQNYPTDWYISKSDGPAGFVVRASKHKTLQFTSAELVGAIAKAINAPPFSFLSFELVSASSGLLALDVKHPKVTPPKSTTK